MVIRVAEGGGGVHAGGSRIKSNLEMGGGGGGELAWRCRTCPYFHLSCR